MEWRDGAALSEAEFLAAYRVEDYPRPSVACDMVVFTVGQTQADSYRQLPEQQLVGFCGHEVTSLGKKIGLVRM